MIIHFCYPPAFIGYTLKKHRHNRGNELPVNIKLSSCTVSFLNTCLLYSESASYTFHPFSGKTCPYSKAKICCGDWERRSSVGGECRATVSEAVWLTITHQPIGNRKCKFHQHFENGLPECVLHLLVCKSQITHVLQKGRAAGHGQTRGSTAAGKYDFIVVKQLHVVTVCDCRHRACS